MRLRVHGGGAVVSVQRGFALIAILSLAALMSAFLIASALNLTSAGNSNEREQRSMNALRQAKAALIAYAASEQWQAYKGQTTNQPGGLPCPDINDTGASPGICATTAQRIGRLPWMTIGSEDLRDASGERLWYAVSSNFYKNAANIINSDTPGLLVVTGKASASNVVAVVIAPGEAISGQDRIAQHNNPAAYLEGVTVGSPLPPDSTFDTIALPSGTANDRLIAITQSDLMAAVEPVVAARIERDIKPYITQNYLSANGWSGGYPFAVSWGGGPGQAQDNYKGDATTPTYRGLMPITREPSWVAWDPPSVSVSDYDPLDDTGVSDITSVNCGASTASQIVCVVDYSGSADRPGIRLQATLLNAGRSFINPASKSNTSITQFDGSSGNWSNSLNPNPQLITNTLLANGNATVAFYGRLTRANSTSRPVTIRVAVPSYHPISSETPVVVAAASNASPISITTSTPHGFPTGVGVTISGVSGNTAANGNWTVTVADSTHFTLNSSTGNGGYISGGTASSLAAWFIANRWYRQTYYAVAQGYVPGGIGSCTAGGTCLTVNNLPAPFNNKRLILVFAGRALDGSTRPTNNLANYFEGENFTPNDLIFEHRSGVPTAINDRVVIVSP